MAEQVGVSVMTVSNAFNRPEQLSSELRERVLETARRLGYAGPDPLARGLRRGRTGAIGVLYDNRLSYVFRDGAAVAFMRGVSSVADDAGLALVLVPGTPPEERDAGVVAAAMVDGFVVYSVADGDAILAAARDRGLPVAVVDQPRSGDLPLVGIDDRAAAAEAAGHLLGLGHRRIAVITFALAPDGRSGLVDPARRAAARYAVTRARLDGYEQALAAAGVDPGSVPVFECQGSSEALGRDAAAELFAADPAPTALLASSDALAAGAIERARELGLSVPDDLSVVGFDDTAATVPPLTTVHQDHEEKGRTVGRLLLAGLAREPREAPPLLPTRLVVRASTARPRRGQ